jgi:hypothetical protein
MKSAKSFGFCLGQKKKNKTKRLCFVLGEMKTPVCSRTVHSRAVSFNGVLKSKHCGIGADNLKNGQGLVLIHFFKNCLGACPFFYGWSKNLKSPGLFLGSVARFNKRHSFFYKI